MTLVKCLYCDAENDALATAGYCDSCGKKLPSSAMVRTRRTLSGGVEVEDAGQAGVARGPGARAFEALTVAAVVHLVCGGLFLILGPPLFRQVPADFLSLVLVWAMVPTIALGGLLVVARRSPQAATLAGLAFGLTWVGATFALDAAMAQRWLLVQAVLLALLARAAVVARR